MIIYTTDTQVGQNNRDAQAAPFGRASQMTWVLEAVWQASDGIPHARLFNKQDRLRMKTMSISVLKDRPHSSLGYRPPAPEAILPRPAVQPYATLQPAQQGDNPRQNLS